jgi:hypothetical protein
MAMAMSVSISMAMSPVSATMAKTDAFLKVAYRNHSEHAHDDPYDMEKAASILIHVREFMQELAKGGLSE